MGEPTAKPTTAPTPQPTQDPTVSPTPQPPPQPSSVPTPQPTQDPTASPTPQPTPQPSPAPTSQPTPEPTASPTRQPDPRPSLQPTAKPTTTAPRVTYVAARDATASCRDANGDDVLTEVECEYACSVISAATRYKAGRWNHAAGCFIVVSGHWAGGCHWNHNAGAGSNNEYTRSICAKQASAPTAEPTPIPTTMALQVTYVAAMDATTTCADENSEDVLSEVECENACSVISGATRYKAGRWNHAAGCFIVVSDNWAGGCHWNHNFAAGANNQHTRSICAKQATAGIVPTVRGPTAELVPLDAVSNFNLRR